MHDILIADAKVSKAKIYPRVRNQFNENPPIYRSQGILANPNSFPTVKLVLWGIKDLTDTSKVHKFTLRMVANAKMKIPRQKQMTYDEISAILENSQLEDYIKFFKWSNCMRLKDNHSFMTWNKYKSIVIGIVCLAKLSLSLFLVK